MKVAKWSEKNNGEFFFDLTPAVFWGNDFLSYTHPVYSKKKKHFYLLRYFNSENANRFLSSIRSIWAFVEQDSMKNKGVNPLWKMSIFVPRPKNWHFSDLTKVDKIKISTVTILMQKNQKKILAQKPLLYLLPFFEHLQFSIFSYI